MKQKLSPACAKRRKFSMGICWPRRPLERGGCSVDYNERQRAQLWLYTYVCPAIDRFRRILREIGSPEEIFAAPPDALEKFVGADTLARMRRQNSAAFVDALLERLRLRGIYFICRGDDDYPQCFEDMKDFIVPPEVLFMRGDRRALNGRSVAIVGTRSADNEGLEIARSFAHDLARSGVNVITGMALGVDAAAAEGALDGGGRVLGVMGCGVDVPYPAGNQKLVRRMLDSGSALVSEYLPTTNGKAYFFPIRNRIMAALAEITLIVQAPKRSGALNTASHALNCGRDVFVVPGSIRNACFAGSNALLRDGAAPALESIDLLETMGISPSDEIMQQAADLSNTARKGKSSRAATSNADANDAASGNTARTGKASRAASENTDANDTASGNAARTGKASRVATANADANDAASSNAARTGKASRAATANADVNDTASGNVARTGKASRAASANADANDAASANRPMPSLNDDELSVVKLLYERERSFDEIVSQTDLDTAKLNSLLTMLKIKGIIYETTGKHYRIKDRTET